MKRKNSAILIAAFLLLSSCSESRQPRQAEQKPDPAVAVEIGQQVIAVQDQVMENDAAPAQLQAADKYEPGGSRKTAAPLMLEQAANGTGAAHHQYQMAAENLPIPSGIQPYSLESYNTLAENGFINSSNDPLSTFSIDVDTASYANVRRFITGGSLPPSGAVRAEEMINYFSYDYPGPSGPEPFSLSAEVGPSPFHDDCRLVRIGLKARDLPPDQLPPANLVFLIDVSGSMNQPNKLPLLKRSLKMLSSQLSARDRVAIVVYAGADRVVLQPTAGSNTKAIADAIDQLQSGGSTHGSQGILTAYALARQQFIVGGNNRVILASDGDFNVGVTSRDALEKLISEQRHSGIYLTVLGFGMGNLHDDILELLADKGNGNYAYIDSLLEAKKVLVKEMNGTLFTLAHDVKIQVEFNPAQVGAYRLIGYENRRLADEDFRDDSKDAGEIGLGHRVTALYELMPPNHPALPPVDRLTYQQTSAPAQQSSTDLLTVKLRYKPQGVPDSRQISIRVTPGPDALVKTSDDFRFAAAVAGFAMLLQESPYIDKFSWQDCLKLSREARGGDQEGLRAEFSRLVEAAQLLHQGS